MPQLLAKFRTLRPAFFSGLLDDPILLVKNRITGKALLFDCGQLHHLAKRLLMSLEAVFISHGHMDHLMGVDLLFRHLHALPRHLHLFGPPGLTDLIHHKLQGYQWNLAEDFWGTFEVHEVGATSLTSTLFPGPAGFVRRKTTHRPLKGDIIYRNEQLQVRARLGEHRVPSLLFRVDEHPFFLIDRPRLEAAGFRVGPWLGILKRCLKEGGAPPQPIEVPRPDGTSITLQHETDVTGLYRRIRKTTWAGSLGYISDIGWTEASREAITALMPGVRLLLCECTFTTADKERARQSAHLCTEDVNWVLERIRPAALVPMHMSKRYRDQGETLYRELMPPAGTQLIRIPEFVTPAPLTMNDLP